MKNEEYKPEFIKLKKSGYKYDFNELFYRMKDAGLINYFIKQLDLPDDEHELFMQNLKNMHLNLEEAMKRTLIEPLHYPKEKILEDINALKYAQKIIMRHGTPGLDLGGKKPVGDALLISTFSGIEVYIRELTTISKNLRKRSKINLNPSYLSSAYKECLFADAVTMQYLIDQETKKLHKEFSKITLETLQVFCNQFFAPYAHKYEDPAIR